MPYFSQEVDFRDIFNDFPGKAFLLYKTSYDFDEYEINMND